MSIFVVKNAEINGEFPDYFRFPAGLVWFCLSVFCLYFLPAAAGNDGEKSDKKEAAGGGAPGQKAKPLTPAAKFLRKAPGQIEDFTFGAAGVKEAENFCRQAKGRGKLPFQLLLCEYYRRTLDRPDKAVRLIGSYVFTKEQLSAWEKANDAAFKTAESEYATRLAEWKKNNPAAGKKDVAGSAGKNDGETPGKTGETSPRPDAPSPLCAPLPPADSWKIDEHNVAAAVELASCLSAAGQIQEAINAIDRIGQNFKDESRVLAAECGGDLFLKKCWNIPGRRSFTNMP